LYANLIDVAHRLAREGWTLESIPYSRGDLIFAQQAMAAGVTENETRLFNDPDGLYKGIEVGARLPYMLGTRGHAQMVPFGMGAIPISPLVHNKLRYFARDIGHPELTVDPRQADFADRLYRTIRAVDENRTELFAEMDGIRQRFYEHTLSNLTTIYERLTGRRVPASYVAYTPFERRLADRAYHQGLSRDRSDQRLQELTRELPQSQATNDGAHREADRLLILAKAAAERGAYRDARTLLRGIEVVNPDHFARRPRPRWDSGALRAVPAGLLPALHRARRLTQGRG
jgi:hypothetical protein